MYVWTRVFFKKKKMEMTGIRGVVLDLFTDYLAGRSQRVKVGEHCSSDEPVTFGVPQGSVLGPSLFLIYINNLCKLKLKNCKIFTFADDTALVFQGKSWEEARISAENGLREVAQWMDNNILTLNTSKTRYITFGINQGQIPSEGNFIIRVHRCVVGSDTQCSCDILERTKTVKYLGILLDQTLTWKPQIEVLSGRLRKLIYIFRTIRCLADANLVKMIYFTLAQSVLTYCISSWGGACKTYLLQVERAQRSILKVMSFKKFRYPTRELYMISDVLSVRQLFIKDIILGTHSKLKFDPKLNIQRRKDTVCPSIHTRTFFINKFQCYLGPTLYNKINKILNIYPLNLYNLKSALTIWLKTLNYDETENLFYILR